MSEPIKILYVHGYEGHGNGKSSNLVREALNKRGIEYELDAPEFPVTEPDRMSASVTVYSQVNSLYADGARDSIVHSSPVSSSVTVMPSIVTLPSFMTVTLYAMLSPRAYPVSGVDEVVSNVTVKCGLGSSTETVALPGVTLTSGLFLSGDVPVAVVVQRIDFPIFCISFIMLFRMFVKIPAISFCCLFINSHNVI